MSVIYRIALFLLPGHWGDWSDVHIYWGNRKSIIVPLKLALRLFLPHPFAEGMYICSRISKCQLRMKKRRLCSSVLFVLALLEFGV